VIVTPAPCSVTHWGALSHENSIAAHGWLKEFKRLGSTDFFADIGEAFIHNYRPIERGAVVVLGAFFPEHELLRMRIRAFYNSRDTKNAIAAIYALTPRLDVDEHLRDWCMLKLLKLRAFPQTRELQDAFVEALNIWQTSNATGLCGECTRQARP